MYPELSDETFGQELTLDLYECDLSVINSKKKLEQYVIKLCKLIKMKRYGEPLIPFFGLEKPKTAGYSLVQLIETSAITGHFSNLWLSAYINIFSCKGFDADAAAEFTRKYFGAKEVMKKLQIRGSWYFEPSSIYETSKIAFRCKEELFHKESKYQVYPAAQGGVLNPAMAGLESVQIS